MHLRCTLRYVSAIGCVPAAQRETANLICADEISTDEAVRSDRRGLLETCERRDWRIRDPTWRKSSESGENVKFTCKKTIISHFRSSI